jgi:hypothetical protein
MKLVCAVVISLFAGLGPVRPAEHPLQELGLPWQAGDIPIRWEASLSQLPSSATVYRVVSAAVSPSVLSNLLALAGLNHRNRVRPSWDGARDRDLSFRDTEETVFLDFVPDEGFVILRNTKAIVLERENVRGVPSWEEALQLAETILPKLGISRADLVHQEAMGRLCYTPAVQRHGWFDATQHKVVTTDVARELFLIRAFNGIASIGMGGGGGIRFSFGSGGQLAELKMVWRAVKPKMAYRVAAEAQFTEWLRSGKCVCELDSPWQIQALAINKVLPYYFERPGCKPQQELHPIAELQAEARLVGTNVSVRLYCPLLKYD